MPISTSDNGSNRFFVSRNFALLWSAQAFASFGEYVLGSTVVVWLITELAKGDPLLPTYVGAVVIASASPRVFVAPFAGTWVDRWRAKRTMVATDLLRAAAFIPIFLIVGGSSNSTIILAMLALLLTTASLSQFFNPSRAAVMQVVIPANRRVDASSKSTFAGLGVAVIATMLGPGLFALFGPAPSLVINMITFMVSAFLIALTRNIQTIHADQIEGGRYWTNFRNGFRTAWRSRSIRILLVGVSLYGVSLGINNSVLSLYALDTLNLKPSEYGIVASMFPVGGLLGTLVAPIMLKRLGNERAFSTSIVGLGLAYMGYAFTSSFLTAGIVMALAGLAFSTYVVAQGPILQAATPVGYMGRITSITVPVLALSSLIATFVSSQVISAFALAAADQGAGIDPQIFGWAIFGGACVLTSGGFFMMLGLRNARLTEMS